MWGEEEQKLGCGHNSRRATLAPVLCVSGHGVALNGYTLEEGECPSVGDAERGYSRYNGEIMQKEEGGVPCRQSLSACMREGPVAMGELEHRGLHSPPLPLTSREAEVGGAG